MILLISALGVLKIIGLVLLCILELGGLVFLLWVLFGVIGSME